MIPDIGPLAQAAIGTLFTWFLTALGAAVVVIFSGSQMKLLHASLGFAAGVMLAASFWSLLSPAIELAEQSKHYGDNGEYAFLPVSVGFLFGGLFVYLTDLLISSFGLCAPQLLLVMQKDAKNQIKREQLHQRQESTMQTGLTIEDVPSLGLFRKSGELESQRIDYSGAYDPVRSYAMFSSSDPTSLNCHEANNISLAYPAASTSENPRSRFLLKGYPKLNKDNKRRSTISSPPNVHELQMTNYSAGDNLDHPSDSLEVLTKDGRSMDQWKRIVLLIVAITVHNIPEGLAVGVGFGAIGSAPSATFENARNLAIGIGIQNFPEGLAVSLPLKAVGFSLWKSFWYGQLSGMVEPIFGILGAAAVSLAKPLLPYALSFAAGAMIYVVVDDIIPEANSDGREKLATSATIIGFVVMMALDVGLGG